MKIETSRALMSSLPAATAKQMHSALKQVIKRSILVLDAMGDIDAKFRMAGIWNRAIDDAWFAYGQNTTRVRLVPTSREIAQAETVGDWLLWLGRAHGGVSLLVSWAHDEPIWRLAERHRCSERTVHSRIDRAIGAILTEFAGQDAKIEVIEERARPRLPNFMTERPIVIDEAAPIDQHGKCWIDGVGWMFRGKRMSDGRNKVTDGMLHGR